MNTNSRSAEYGSINNNSDIANNDNVGNEAESYQTDSSQIVSTAGFHVYETHHSQYVSSPRITIFGRIFLLVLLVAVTSIGTISLFKVSRSDYGEVGFNVDVQQHVADVVSPIAVAVAQAEPVHDRRVSLIVSNEYGTLAPPYPWLDETSKAILFEAYKMMNVEIIGWNSSPGDVYVWTLKELDGSVITQVKTDTLIAEFESNAIGTRRLLSLEIQDMTTNQLSFSLEYTVYTKYVKRELHSLTVADREKFLDAASLLWKYTTSEGRDKFGDEFTSITTFVMEHAFASNDIMCDQFHDGTGFYTRHLALQLSFDAALRAIDPTLVLPYWDFTVEGQAIEDAGETPAYFKEVTSVLSDTWFGATDKYDHVVDSRWAHATFPTEENLVRTQRNSYGVMRSYWNNNNDPELTRHSFDTCGIVSRNRPIPTCLSHFEVLDTSSLGDFLSLVPAKVHGPMHVNLGGVGGSCVDQFAKFKERWTNVLEREYTDEELFAMGLDDDNITSIRRMDALHPIMGLLDFGVVGEYFHIYRSLWRSHMCARDGTVQLLQCPEDCSPDKPTGECQCSIPSLMDGSTDWENVLPCLFAGDGTMRDIFIKFMPAEMLEDLTHTVAKAGVIEGDLLESSSPADPLFWMLHPVLHRLEHAKRLHTVNYMTDKPIKKWNTVDDLKWLDYSYYTLEPDMNEAYPEGYKCTGHGANDPVLPMAIPLPASIIQRIDTNADGVITNIEFFQGTDPNNADSTDFVFDNFEWSHCEGKLNF